jgi:hypothetical protein
MADFGDRAAGTRVALRRAGKNDPRQNWAQKLDER